MTQSHNFAVLESNQDRKATRCVVKHKNDEVGSSASLPYLEKHHLDFCGAPSLHLLYNWHDKYFAMLQSRCSTIVCITRAHELESQCPEVEQATMSLGLSLGLCF